MYDPERSAEFRGATLARLHSIEDALVEFNRRFVSLEKAVRANGHTNGNGKRNWKQSAAIGGGGIGFGAILIELIRAFGV